MQAIAITTPAVKPAVKDNFFTRMIERIKSPKDTQPKLRPLSLVVGVTEKEAAMRQGFWKRVQQVTRLACFLSQRRPSMAHHLKHMQNIKRAFKTKTFGKSTTSGNVSKKEALAQFQKSTALFADAESDIEDEEFILTLQKRKWETATSKTNSAEHIYPDIVEQDITEGFSPASIEFWPVTEDATHVPVKTTCFDIKFEEALCQFQISSGLFSDVADAEEDEDEDEDEEDWYYAPFDHSAREENKDFAAEKSYPAVEMAQVVIQEAQRAVVEYWAEPVPEACSAVVEFWPTSEGATDDSATYEGNSDASSDVTLVAPTPEELKDIVPDIFIEEIAHKEEVATDPTEVNLGLFTAKDLDYLLPPTLSGSQPEPEPVTVNISRASGKKFSLAAPPAPLRRRSVNVAKFNSEGIKRTTARTPTRAARRGKENARPAGLLSAISE